MPRTFTRSEKVRSWAASAPVPSHTVPLGDSVPLWMAVKCSSHCSAVVDQWVAAVSRCVVSHPSICDRLGVPLPPLTSATSDLDGPSEGRNLTRGPIVCAGVLGGSGAQGGPDRGGPLCERRGGDVKLGVAAADRCGGGLARWPADTGGGGGGQRTRCGVALCRQSMQAVITDLNRIPHGVKSITAVGSRAPPVIEPRWYANPL
jgi:hypothetical protein